MITTIDIAHDGGSYFGHVWVDGWGHRYEMATLDAIIRVISRVDPTIVTAELYQDGRRIASVRSWKYVSDGLTG